MQADVLHQTLRELGDGEPVMLFCNTNPQCGPGGCFSPTGKRLLAVLGVLKQLLVTCLLIEGVLVKAVILSSAPAAQSWGFFAPHCEHFIECAHYRTSRERQCSLEKGRTWFTLGTVLTEGAGTFPTSA
jgi:hypothetical protein